MPLLGTIGASSARGFGRGGKGFTPFTATYLVIAGGGGGGCGSNASAGGGGAGGYRTSYNCETSGGGGATESAIEFTAAGDYTITVGAGGTGQFCSGGCSQGSDSVLNYGACASITSLGGGGGTLDPIGNIGGSGGAGDYRAQTPANFAGTAGQGRPAGQGSGLTSPTFNVSSGGGGGASGNGQNAPPAAQGGNGGAGQTSTISGSPVTRAGGGGGDSRSGLGSGGPGGGGNATLTNTTPGGGGNGTVNTGSGGGANNQPGSGSYAGNGGSGIVYIRLPACASASVAPGTNTIAPAPGCEQLATFTVTGTLTVE